MLTDKIAREATAEGRKQRIIYDEGPRSVTGFGLRVTAAGSKAWILNYTAAGTERRLTIAGFPAVGCQLARQRARELRQRVDLGEDPLAVDRAARAAPTVADLLARYEEEHLPRKRESSAINDRSMIRNHILPAMGKRKVADISFADVDKLHRAMRNHPVAANRVLSLLSKAMALAVRWQMRADNPCKGIERFQEEKRERYLTDDEMQRLLAAVAKAPPTAAAIIRICLLTGCRFGEAAGMRWDQIDFGRATWTKAASVTKQKRMHSVPLSPLVMVILSELPRTNEWVFARRVDNIRKAWSTVLRRAQIDDLRVHDLRHCVASMLASSGWSLPQIGAVLGHTNAATTARYAHLFPDVTRAAVAEVADIVEKNDRGLTLRRVS